MTQAVREEIQWANPAALGLAGFGFNTILLQIHNVGWIESTLPLVYGLFWGGMAQIIAGLIDARRGDTFGLTAFASYGLFWLGLSFSFLLTVKRANSSDDSNTQCQNPNVQCPNGRISERQLTGCCRNRNGRPR